MSGPAGGLLGGIWVGKSAGFDSVVTLDVGGTSADIGVAPGGEVLYKHILDTRLGDYHAMVAMAEVDSIGAAVGWPKLEILDGQLRKQHPALEIDLSAIAAGWATLTGAPTRFTGGTLPISRSIQGARSKTSG